MSGLKVTTALISPIVPIEIRSSGSSFQEKSRKEISLYEPIGTDREGNEIKLYDIIETDEEEVAEKIHLKENIHKNFIFYASGSIGGEAVSFVRIKSDNGFDQSDCADRDQVFGIFFGILIFFDYMCDKS